MSRSPGADKTRDIRRIKTLSRAAAYNIRAHPS